MDDRIIIFSCGIRFRDILICYIIFFVFYESISSFLCEFIFPQGGVDGEEDPRVAAFRELKEETGVTSAEILVEVGNL